MSRAGATAWGIVAAALVGCAGPFVTSDAGAPLGEPVRGTLSNLGGSVRAADGRFAVSVAAGSLTEPVELTITPISAEAPGAVGLAYRVGPASLAQRTAFTVEFLPTSAELAVGPAASLAIVRQAADGRWERFGDELRSGVAQNVRRAALPASGDWALTFPGRMTPARAEVGAGQFATFAVEECGSRAEGEHSFLTAWSATGLDALVSRWAVSGAAGTLTPNGARATLRAGSARGGGTVSASLYSRAVGTEVTVAADVKVLAPISQLGGPFTLAVTEQGVRVEAAGSLELDKLGGDADPQPYQGRAHVTRLTSDAHPGCTLGPSGAVDQGSSYVWLAADGGVRLLLDLDVTATLRCADAGTVALRAFDSTCGELGSIACASQCPASDFRLLQPAPGLSGSAEQRCGAANFSGSWGLEPR